MGDRVDRVGSRGIAWDRGSRGRSRGIAWDRVGSRGIARDRVGSRKRIAYDRVNCRSGQIPGRLHTKPRWGCKSFPDEVATISIFIRVTLRADMKQDPQGVT